MYTLGYRRYDVLMSIRKGRDSKSSLPSRARNGSVQSVTSAVSLLEPFTGEAAPETPKEFRYGITLEGFEYLSRLPGCRADDTTTQVWILVLYFARLDTQPHTIFRSVL